MDMFERKALAWYLNELAKVIENDEDFENLCDELKEFAIENEMPDDAKDDFKSVFNDILETAKESYLEYLEKSDDEG